MKPKKVGANERRLAKLLHEILDEWCNPGTGNDFPAFAAPLLARRGVLAVSTKTVNCYNALGFHPTVQETRDILRKIARGAR